MRKILISTNMYKGSEFGQVLPYLKRFPGQVGVEVFPMFHEECFEKNLRDAMPLLKEVPVSFHGPYYQAEHSAAEGTVEYARTMELLEKTLSYAKELSSKYLVYHHNNCRIIPGYPLHAVLCKEGSFTCAVVSVSITLTGKTSHAAEPQKGISPIPAILKIVDELSRWNNTDMQSDDYFLSTIVEIHVGEEAYGVSAGNGVIRATLRAKTDKLLHQHAEQLKNLVATECERTPGLQHEMEWLEPFSANENDPQSVSLIKSATIRNNLPYLELQTPFSWGEDFGLFTQQYKGAMFGLGSGENCPPLHSPQYDFPDEVIETGATLFYTIAEANQ